MTAATSDEFGKIGLVKDGFIVSRVWCLIAVYFMVCYAGVIVSYYSPFLMQGYGLSSSDVGTVTALFFLAVFLPGFILPYIVKGLKQATLIVSAAIMTAGIFLMTVSQHFGMLCLAAMLVGAGYGVFQPLIYDKATQVITVITNPLWHSRLCLLLTICQ